MSDNTVYRAKVSIYPATNNIVCTMQSILRQLGKQEYFLSECLLDEAGWLSFIVNTQVKPSVSHLEYTSHFDGKMLKLSLSETEPLQGQLQQVVNVLQRIEINQKKQIGIQHISVEKDKTLIMTLFESIDAKAVDPTKPVEATPYKEARYKETGTTDMDLLLLIDGNNLMNRSYYGTAYGVEDETKLMKTKTGIFTNGIKVFLEKLLILLKTHKPSHVAICWDVRRAETFRKMIYPEYKGTRSETPQPLVQQIATAKEVLKNMGFPNITVPMFEADDLLGTLAKRWIQDGGKSCLIYSNDRDLYQILDENISQIIVRDKQEIIYSLQDFKDEHLNIEPFQFIDVKALLGDKGDNIPGIPGVGEKAALPLIKMYGSLEKIYESIDNLDTQFKRYIKKLKEGAESGLLSKKLATIMIDVPEMHNIAFDELKWHVNLEGCERELLRLELPNLLQNFKSLVG